MVSLNLFQQTAMEVLLAVNAKLTPRVPTEPGFQAATPYEDDDDGYMQVSWKWNLDCTPAVFLKDPGYVSEGVVKQIEEIRG